MRRIVFSVLIVAAFAFTASAQEVELKDLKVPNSPGFQILDIAPSTVEKPANPKALAVSLFSLTNNGTAVPKNFAFSITPYWYTKEKVSLRQYLNIPQTVGGKTQKNLSGIFTKLNISAASSFSDSTSGSLLKNTNYMALGVQTNLLALRSAGQTALLESRLSDIAKRQKALQKKHLDEPVTAINKDINRFEDEIDELETDLNQLAILRQNAGSDSAKKKIDEIVEQKKKKKESTQQRLKESEEKLEALKAEAPNDLADAVKNDKEIQKLFKELGAPPVFQLNVAGAYSMAIPDNVFANHRFNRVGAWTTASVAINPKGSLSTNVFTLSLAFRVIGDNLLADTLKSTFIRKTFYDFGGSMAYNASDFSFSFEYLKRGYTNLPIVGNERTVGMIQYKLSDDVYLTGSFGKNFGQKDLFTMFGMNWGFGKKVTSVN